MSREEAATLPEQSEGDEVVSRAKEIAASDCNGAKILGLCCGPGQLLKPFAVCSGQPRPGVRE
jgi:hypothetical protein